MSPTLLRGIIITVVILVATPLVTVPGLCALCSEKLYHGIAPVADAIGGVVEISTSWALTFLIVLAGALLHIIEEDAD